MRFVLAALFVFVVVEKTYGGYVYTPCTPAYYGNWGQWSACTQKCGDEDQYRTRQCYPGNCEYATSCSGPDREKRSCKLPCCPQDGQFTKWGEWGRCSKTCGGGSQVRSRRCEGRKCGGKGCFGSVADRRDCNTQCCPKDGYLSQWGPWDKCSKTCGVGYQSRHRACVGQACGGKDCDPYQPLYDKRSCEDRCCPVDGKFTKWGAWGRCSKTCGGGSQLRARRCEGKKCGGKGCFGSVADRRDCNTQCCPKDGSLSEWGPWGKCSKTCGGGSQSRHRSCEGQACGGKGCDPYEPLYQNRTCAEKCCPEDGKFTKWGEWGRCSKTCGGGSQVRSRRCEGRKCGGKGCFGSVADRRPCNTKCCPKDGYFSQWGPWDKCSKTCGVGYQSRHRACVGPVCGGKDCDPYQPLYDKRSCEDKCCPVDGKFTKWGEWGRCSKTCGGGSQVRSRRCEGRKCGGKGCFGSVADRRPCNTKCCPKDGYFTEWGPWDKCSKTCGEGYQSRHRACVDPVCGGKDCDPYEPLYEKRSCEDKCCPVDGKFTEWGKFGRCSKTCGGGTRVRSRRCEGRKCGGKGCFGPVADRRDCNTQCCPKDGFPGEWGPWSKCSKSCGGGSQSRHRACEGQACGGKDCDPNDPLYEKRSCGKKCCPVDGGWSSWGEFGKCNVSCGWGRKYRKRTCTYPKPQCGGKRCRGNASDSADCDFPPCKKH